MRRELRIQPGRGEFLRLAGRYRLVPVFAELTSDTTTAFSIFSRVAAGGRNPFLLESVEGGERAARYSFVGVDPWRIIEIRNGRAFVDGASKEGSPLEILRRETRINSCAPVEGLPPFAGGALGMVGYDAVRLVEDLGSEPPDETGLPEAWFGLYDNIIALDRARQRLLLVHPVRIDGDPERAWERAQEGIARLHRRISREAWTPRPHSIPDLRGNLWSGWEATPPEEDYLKAVKAAREYILSGDIFQVVLSRRWRKMARCRAEEIYRMLRLTNPSPYMFFLDTGHARIFGSSPEMLVETRRKTVRTCPIAGTRPRGADETEDRRLEEELLADPKERAEHVMLVDLGRNDLGRVSKPGTIRLRREMAVERYSHVMHIVSELEGELRDDADAWDALFSCFPAGTLSGAPKIRAMEIIDELEKLRRGIYGGAVGYLNLDGDLDFCIAIRTGVECGGVVQVQAGAGIVYDSIPEKELGECRAKASALVRAVQMAEQAAADGGLE